VLAYHVLGPTSIASISISISISMSMDLPLIDRLPDVTPALDKSVGLPSSNIACTVDAPGDSTVSINDTESNNIPLVSEHAVLSCMAYVDLNPVRAAMAPTPEESDHTSIQLRIEYWKNKSEQLQGKGTIDDDENLQPESLMPFAGNPRQPMPPGIAFNLPRGSTESTSVRIGFKR